MNIPLQFGWPQLILLFIGLVGLWLFITAGLGLLSPGSFLSEDEKERYYRTGLRPRRRFRVTRGLGGIVLLAVAVSLLWVTFLVQSYIGLTGEIKVAHVRATAIANVPHQMSVELAIAAQPIDAGLADRVDIEPRLDDSEQGTGGMNFGIGGLERGGQVDDAFRHDRADTGAAVLGK